VTIVREAPEGLDLQDPVEPRRAAGTSKSPVDVLFRIISRASGSLVLVIMGVVGIFLFYRAWDALSAANASFLTTQAWEPDSGNFGIAGILTGTVLIGVTAIVIAVPFALSTALFISEYSPRRLQRTFVQTVDLMAAVPSVVYGLWGAFFMQNHAYTLALWLSSHFGWIPFFNVDADPNDPLTSVTNYKSSTFLAGIVVAMMVTPIASSVMRETFSQAPPGEREGAYALGATKWGMIRAVVLPYGKGGIIGGTMLGLGRALGETIAVYMIISPVYTIQPHILQKGAISVSSLIALKNGEASDFGRSALFAAGLALFIMTLVVNFLASQIVARSRSGQSSEA
jgi:phosphate transport system permease protein